MITHRAILIGAATGLKIKHQDLGPDDKKWERLSERRVTPDSLCGGPLFKRRIDYANRSGHAWYVLSAKHGIWPPRVPLRYDDQSVEDLSSSDFAIWHANACRELANEMWEASYLDYFREFGQTAYRNAPAFTTDPKNICFEFHASHAYCFPLSDMLKALGFKCRLPMKGLSLIEQVAWYSKRRRRNRV